MEQLSLFNRIDNQNYNTVLKIKSKFREYGIDKLYEKKFCNGNTYTFHEILETLKKYDNYKEYIKQLFIELSCFYTTTNDAYSNKTENIQIEQRDDCIILATYRVVGPIFSVKMLENRLKESEEMKKEDKEKELKKSDRRRISN